MGVDGNLEHRETRIERLESVSRISLLAIVIAVALTVLGFVFADDLSVSRITVGVIGAAFVLAFAVQRQKVKALLSRIHEEQAEG